MSSETAGPAPKPVTSKGARVSSAIVVSTQPTATLRAEQLDGSTLLLVCSGRLSEPYSIPWASVELVQVSGLAVALLPAGAGQLPADAGDELRQAIEEELLPHGGRRRRRDNEA